MVNLMRSFGGAVNVSPPLTSNVPPPLTYAASAVAGVSFTHDYGNNSAFTMTDITVNNEGANTTISFEVDLNDLQDDFEIQIPPNIFANNTDLTMIIDPTSLSSAEDIFLSPTFETSATYLSFYLADQTGIQNYKISITGASA